MAAYAPIAARVFGATSIHVYVRLWLMSSLVLSRLIYNVHLWVVEPRSLAKLVAVQMRVARRIAGQLRFSSTSESTVDGRHLTDQDVRVMLCMPSIDCVLRRARLLYAARVTRSSKAHSLQALLSLRPKGQPLPWAKQLHDDLVYMYEHTSISVCVIHPDCKGSQYSWIHAMRHEPAEWSHCVREIFYTASVLDSKQLASQGHVPELFAGEGEAHNPTQVMTEPLPQWVCKLCDPACLFVSEKSLQSHMRSKHKLTSIIPQYINKSGICPACGTFFQTRIRVIAHLSDRRRPRCRDRVLAGEFPALPFAEFAALQDEDRTTRRKALHAGHTHPLACGQAVNAEGVRTGHVTH